MSAKKYLILFPVQVLVEDKDAEGLPFAFLKSVEFRVGGREVGKVNFGEGKPFQCQLGDEAKKVVVRLGFHAHYGEPPLDIPIDIITGSGGWILIINYNHTHYVLAQL